MLLGRLSLQHLKFVLVSFNCHFNISFKDVILKRKCPMTDLVKNINKFCQFPSGKLKESKFCRLLILHREVYQQLLFTMFT